MNPGPYRIRWWLVVLTALIMTVLSGGLTSRGVSKLDQAVVLWFVVMGTVVLDSWLRRKEAGQ